MNPFFGAQFDPSDDTWQAIVVYPDGNPIVLARGFLEQETAEDFALSVRKPDRSKS